MLLTSEVLGLDVCGSARVVRLADGGQLSAHAVLVTTGVAYERLPVPDIDEFTGRGVYYGGTATEAESVRDDDVYIGGGANSAGQAAVFFSRSARSVTIVIRGDSSSVRCPSTWSSSWASCPTSISASPSSSRAVSPGCSRPRRAEVQLTSSDVPGSYAGATRAVVPGSQDEAYASSLRAITPETLRGLLALLAEAVDRSQTAPTPSALDAGDLEDTLAARVEAGGVDDAW